MVTAITIALAGLFLNGCSTVDKWIDKKEAPPLEGERVSVLEMQTVLKPDSEGESALVLTVPPAWRNEYWPQAGGYANHAMQHLTLAAEPLERQWKSSIGHGAAKGLPLTAQPIVVDDKIFTLDTRSNLTAFSLVDGKKIWERNVRDQNEDDPVIGGGLAYSKGQLYVTNGYNEILALSPADGAPLWRMPLPAAARAAPTIMNDRVFVITLDNRLLTLDAEDGRILWDFSGLNESTGLVGAASPAAAHDTVVPAFSSGEIFALRVENGAIAWGENLASFRRTSGLSGLSDISALPIIDKEMIIATSFGGRIAAFDLRTGTRIWQREIGSSQTPWIAGHNIFMVSTNNEVVALARDSGAILWVSPLPRYHNPEKKKGPIFWSGPILAGGRLILAGTNGDIAELDPQNGDILSHWDGGDSFSIAPIIAGETLYLLDNNGTLSAYK